MLETVKIRRAGFPVRRTFKDFSSRSVKFNFLDIIADLQVMFCCFLHSLFILPVRYKIILKDKVPAAAAADDKKKCTDLLFKYDKTKKEWQLGKTKVRFTFYCSTSSKSITLLCTLHETTFW